MNWPVQRSAEIRQSVFCRTEPVTPCQRSGSGYHTKRNRHGKKKEIYHKVRMSQHGVMMSSDQQMMSPVFDREQSQQHLQFGSQSHFLCNIQVLNEKKMIFLKRILPKMVPITHDLPSLLTYGCKHSCSEWNVVALKTNWPWTKISTHTNLKTLYSKS